MQVSIETIVEIIVRRVVAELTKRGVEIAGPETNGERPSALQAQRQTSVAIDFTDYKTPVLTESHVRAVEPSIREIIIPEGTICTTGAKDLISQKKLVLSIAHKPS